MMTIPKFTCPWCRKTFQDGSAGWDSASRNGRCASCDRFLEIEIEEEVQRLLISDDMVVRTRRRRLIALVNGLVSLVLVVGPLAVAFLTDTLEVVFAFRRLTAPFFGLFATIAMAGLVFAALWNPEREVRFRLNHQMNPSKIIDPC